ncbi:hypothetical protein Tco_0778578 [Tanacetum coccineum]
MTTLEEHIIVAGAEYHPLMLKKSMYDSWASRICLFIKGKKHGRMMLDSIDNGLLVYPTVEENRQTRPKKYSELTEAQQLQDDCDEMIQLNASTKQWHSFVVASRFSPSNNQLRTSSNPKNQATIQDGKVTVQQVQGRQNQSFAGTRNRGIATTSRGNYAAGQAKIIPHNSAFQTEDLDAHDSDCDDISSAKAVLMANLSSCDPDVLSKVPYSDSYLNDMISQDVQEM